VSRPGDPTVSIVIPAFNAGRTLGHALASIAAQPDAGDREVIVVDDGSTDDTAAVAGSFEGVRVIRQANAGPAVARNAGAQAARGRLLVFIDADCEAQPGWLAHMLARFADPEVIAVKGAYRTRQPELIARFVQIEYEDKYDRLARSRNIDFIDTYSAAFRRLVFLGHGGFSAEFPTACAEDVDLSFRMSRAGGRMVFEPEAIVYHLHPNRLLAYAKKKFKFAYWRLLAVKRNPEKIVSDSHTPQLMKAQAVVAPTIPALAAAAIVVPALVWPAIALAAAFAVSTVPFTIKALPKDRAVGAASPALLLVRGIAQGIGLGFGTLHVIRLAVVGSRRRLDSAPVAATTAPPAGPGGDGSM
jgi:cellulose synthase/poly-beta-1,6-N-acetylglucosamine synthase-like glycosyltransferase